MNQTDFRKFGLDLTRVESGEILLGQKSRILEEGKGALYAQSRISLTKAFYISRNLITQGNWDVVFGGLYSKRPGIDRLYEELGEKLRPQILFGNNYPAVFVDWNEAIRYCEGLSRVSGKRVSLPTDAQWEYCYRAGSDGDFFWGDSVDPLITRKYAWHSFPMNGPDQSRLREVGLLQPNAWGIHDMAGLVMEWVRDSVNLSWPEDDSVTVFPVEGKDYWGKSGDQAIVRNASYNFMCQQMTATSKSVLSKTRRSCFVGFRIVVEEE